MDANDVFTHTMTREEKLDVEGKFRVSNLFNQYNVPYNFTEYKYNRVDVYFGRSSVAEIKYRLKYYRRFIIEEDKFKALCKIPCSSQYYIVVTDTDIYFWKTSTIRIILPTNYNLPSDDGVIVKEVRLLPTDIADFHFHLEDGKWILKTFE